VKNEEIKNIEYYSQLGPRTGQEKLNAGPIN